MLNALIISKGYGFAYVKYPFGRMEELPTGGKRNAPDNKAAGVCTARHPSLANSERRTGCLD